MDLTTFALLFLSIVMIGGFALLIFTLKKNQNHDETLNRLSNYFDIQKSQTGLLQEQIANQERALSNTFYKSMSSLGERLALIDKAQSTIHELSNNVVNLQEILGNKQARGAFGEVQLENIVSSMLPPSAYAFQETLDNKRVDCLLHLPNPPGPIAVDSKFPLEGYRAMLESDHEFDQKQAIRTFKTSVMKHINDIHEKYIIPGKTADSAMMFLPSEAIYAELHSNFPDIIEASYKARVWIVCPTTFMATLHTLRAILKDVQMREQAGQIQKHVHALMKDVERLDDRCAKLESHFNNTQENIRLLRITSQKIINRANMIEQVDFEEPHQEDTYGT